MKTKLTLSVDPEIAKQAHQQAKAKGSSISKLFSEHVHRLEQEFARKKRPSVDDMVGIFKGYDIDDSKEGIAAAYAEKYLR